MLMHLIGTLVERYTNGKQSLTVTSHHHNLLLNHLAHSHTTFITFRPLSMTLTLLSKYTIKSIVQKSHNIFKTFITL